MVTDTFQTLTPDEIRTTGLFLPELNGITFWHVNRECDYCQQSLGGEFLILQKVGRNGISLMCIPCVERLFHFHT